MEKNMSKLGNVPHRYARYAEIMFYEDASGWQTFKYGKLGEVIENIRTFALPYDAQTYTFKMNFEYDSWNRIMGMTYPDGEVVSYGYNLGGMLKSVSGLKMNNAYPYIDSIRYNEFELKEAVDYGNGTRCLYGYDVLQRLVTLASYTANNELMQRLKYDYDAVSNITDIDNSAGILANGLGGKYHNRYSYDNLYRLVYSRGNWLGSPNTDYELEMSYNLNGRIGRKTLTAGIVTQTPMTNSFNSVGYDNSYHYTNASQPNTLTYIDNNGPQQFFQWDAKGNMTYHKHEGIPLKRYLCWDEQNRLQGVMDDKSLSVYQYDANGDRTYKLTGDYTYQNVSGTWRYFYQLDNATLYASPYLVVTPRGYTKHYYAENERIASKLGNGGLSEIDQPLADGTQVYDKFNSNTYHAQNVIYECLNAEEVRAYPPLSYLYELTSASQNPEDERYFYHPDHLGSSSWITFTDGEAVQHLHYLPFGEDLVNQQHTVIGAMYTFSAKEKDAETGYSYFGSRYYNSDLSIWLSVDPMAHKYPSLSPYVYCANNPVGLVDPEGEDVWIVAYGANYTNIDNRGQHGDVGNGFKKNAEAYANIIRNSPDFDPDKDEVVLVETKSMEQLAEALNKEYDKGKIAEFTLFSHGTRHGPCLGGQTADEVGEEKASAQRYDYNLRELNSYTMSQINPNNFTDNATVQFYGCNIGGNSKDGMSSSFGQQFADYLGGNRIVKAFVGSSLFTGTLDKPTYPGRMIRAVDQKNQETKFSIYTPR